MDEVVEYILVNKELNMGVGKIAGQVAHAQTVIDNTVFKLEFYTKHHYLAGDGKDKIEEELKVVKDYHSWFSTRQTKIILKAKEKDLLKAIEMGAIEIRDKGLTEIPENSLTVVGFVPQPRSNLRQFTKKFQLL